MCKINKQLISPDSWVRNVNMTRSNPVIRKSISETLNGNGVVNYEGLFIKLDFAKPSFGKYDSVRV